MSISTIAPQVEVSAPTRTPRPYGLFSALGFRDDDSRWQNGVLWQGAPCEPAHGIGQYDCSPEENTVGLPEGFDAKCSGGTGSPFVVYGKFKGSPVGSSAGRAGALAGGHPPAREQA